MRKESLYIQGSAERLNNCILEKNIDYIKVAKAAGISRNTLHSFFYYHTDISGARLAKICKYLNISVDYILGLSKEKELK